LSSERESPVVKTEVTLTLTLSPLIVKPELVGDVFVRTEAVLWL